MHPAADGYVPTVGALIDQRMSHNQTGQLFAKEIGNGSTMEQGNKAAADLEQVFGEKKQEQMLRLEKSNHIEQAINSGISKNVDTVPVDRALARMSQAMDVEVGDMVLKGRRNDSDILAVAGVDRAPKATSVEALECADATDSKAVNMENSDTVVEANTGALTHNDVLRIVDREITDPKVKGAVQLEVVAAQKSEAQVMLNTKAENWAVVHQSHLSPNNKNDTALTKLVSAQKDISISNSFAALVNECGVDSNQMVATTITDNEQEDAVGILQHKQITEGPRVMQEMSPGSKKKPRPLVSVMDGRAVAATEATSTLHIVDPG